MKPMRLSDSAQAPVLVEEDVPQSWMLCCRSRRRPRLTREKQVRGTAVGSWSLLSQHRPAPSKKVNAFLSTLTELIFHKFQKSGLFAAELIKELINRDLVDSL